jgi:hypothetical protein
MRQKASGLVLSKLRGWCGNVSNISGVDGRGLHTWGLDRAWAGVKMGIPLAQFWTYGTSIYIWATGVGHFQNYVAMKIS